MEKGYRKIFWGLLIAIFNINLGPVNILPDFLGYFIIGTGIVNILDEFKNISLNKAKNIANLLFLYHLFMSVISFTALGEIFKGYNYENLVTTGLGIIESLISLMMAFYILAGTIELYLNKGKETEAEHIERVQKKYVILYIIGLLLLSVSINVSSEWYVTVTVIYILAVEIYYAGIISGIRKTFSQNTDEPMN